MFWFGNAKEAVISSLETNVTCATSSVEELNNILNTEFKSKEIRVFTPYAMIRFKLL